MIEAFQIHTGRAIVLNKDNVNTDEIIPSQEIKQVSKSKLADGLFANKRYLYAQGHRVPNPDFVLNQPQARSASVLISGANFGCGSSPVWPQVPLVLEPWMESPSPNVDVLLHQIPQHP